MIAHNQERSVCACGAVFYRDKVKNGHPMPDCRVCRRNRKLAKDLRYRLEREGDPVANYLERCREDKAAGVSTTPEERHGFLAAYHLVEEWRRGG